MGGRALALVASVVLAALPARAGDVEGTLRWSDGAASATRPIAAIVYLTGFTQPPPDQVPVIAQRQKTFIPELIAIVAGQTVRFTNEDTVLHNVFSTSKARPFDLGKPGPGEARDVRFPRPGVVQLYCNIHQTMSATLLVLPNRAFARVDKEGHFVIRDVPEGSWTLFAWGPGLEPFQTAITVQKGAKVAVSITVVPRGIPATHLDKYGRPYRDRSGYAP